MKTRNVLLLSVLTVVFGACSRPAKETGGTARISVPADPVAVAPGDAPRVAPRSAPLLKSNVVALAAGADHALVVRTGPAPPTVRLLRADRFRLPGETAVFAARGEPFGEVRYQWQFQGVDRPGATNQALVLSNVQAGNEGAYRVVVANAFAIAASPDIPFRLVTPPVILSKSPATNPAVYYQGDVTLGVTVFAPGQTNDFPLSYQWRRNGSNIPGAVNASYGFAADRLDDYAVTVGNLAGSATTNWQVAGLDYGSLPYYLATNTAAYAAGRSGNFTDLRLVNGWTYAFYTATNLNLLTNATWSSQCWLSGVKGLSATPIGLSNSLAGQTMLTMVSPRHYLSASHISSGPRVATAAFLDTNNVVHWRRTLEEVAIGNDVSVGLLDADLPPSVGFLPVLAPGFDRYLPRDWTALVQGIGMNQDLFVFGQPLTLVDQETARWDPLQTVQFGLGTNWNVAIRGGDSSLPERLLIGDRLILVSQHYGPQTGPNLAFQFESINRTMHSLSINHAVGTDYQLTPYALTNWPALR